MFKKTYVEFISSITPGTCNYVDCRPAQWSDWSAQCGKDLTRTRLIETVQKTVQKDSCVGLKTKCEKSEETETKDELCKMFF